MKARAGTAPRASTSQQSRTESQGPKPKPTTENKQGQPEQWQVTHSIKLLSLDSAMGPEPWTPGRVLSKCQQPREQVQVARQCLPSNSPSSQLSRGDQVRKGAQIKSEEMTAKNVPDTTSIPESHEKHKEK
jgi:hypothetical protein